MVKQNGWQAEEEGGKMVEIEESSGQFPIPFQTQPAAAAADALAAAEFGKTATVLSRMMTRPVVEVIADSLRRSPKQRNHHLHRH